MEFYSIVSKLIKYYKIDGRTYTNNLKNQVLKIIFKTIQLNYSAILRGKLKSFRLH